MTDEERRYNLEEFAASSVGSTPGATMPARVGSMAPDFEAHLLDGGTIRLSDFRGAKRVVIMTGAVTSPMCAFEIPEFNELQADFGPHGFSFFLLYTRESHPAENYPAHTSFEQKLAHAAELKRLEGDQA